jgi:hypothetical protein
MHCGNEGQLTREQNRARALTWYSISPTESEQLSDNNEEDEAVRVGAEAGGWACAPEHAAALAPASTVASNVRARRISFISRVAMIRPSLLATFWALYPWMNPPPRTGISREPGSVTLRRAGCGASLPA